jgi:phospholipid/cholesterol/gamma-HCH transport system ATP-binding protein
MSEPHIEVVDVHKSFGRKQVLRGLNITVNKGRSLVVIGGSGTGKSVMLKCILGILRPDRGQIRVGGQNAVGLKGEDRDSVALACCSKVQHCLTHFPSGKMSHSD